MDRGGYLPSSRSRLFKWRIRENRRSGIYFTPTRSQMERTPVSSRVISHPSLLEKFLLSNFELDKHRISIQTLRELYKEFIKVSKNNKEKKRKKKLKVMYLIIPFFPEWNRKRARKTKLCFCWASANAALFLRCLERLFRKLK